jgi:hypothetical protein
MPEGLKSRKDSTACASQLFQAKVYNTTMFGSSFDRSTLFARLALFVAVLGLCGTASLHAQDAPKRGRKYKAPPPTTHMVVTVTRASTGKPVENASVIFHPIEDGKSAGNMELKTNDDGQTTLDLLEVGSTVRLQVIANGFQTFGQDFKIDKDQTSIQVKLHRPAEQYSIYKKHEGADTSKDASAEKGVTPETSTKEDSSSPDAQKSTPKTTPQQDTKPQPATNPQ